MLAAALEIVACPLSLKSPAQQLSPAFVLLRNSIRVLCELGLMRRDA